MALPARAKKLQFVSAAMLNMSEMPTLAEFPKNTEDGRDVFTLKVKVIEKLCQMYLDSCIPISLKLKKALDEMMT